MKKTITLLSCALFLGSAVSAQTAPPNYVSQNGLVGWWPFSGNAGDSSGKANHGVVTGNVQLTTDRKGNPNAAYAFDGNGGYINVEEKPELRCRKITMSAWIYWSSPSSDPRNQSILYKGGYTNAAGEAYNFNMGMGTSVKINSGCQAGVGWVFKKYTQQAPVGTWFHVCATLDGDTIRNYYNGVLDSKYAVSGKIDSCIGSDLRFGWSHILYPNSDPFKGKIDEIGIWNRALSEAEISAVYSGIPIPSGINSVATENNFSLSPNPARNAITLSRSVAGEPLEVRVTDLMGRVVLQEAFAGKEKTISINGVLAGGLYIVAVSDMQGMLVFQQKLVVE